MNSEVALVTGATGGIGRAVAEALADAGCAIAATGRDAARLESVRASIESRGQRAAALVADLREPDAADRLLHDTTHALGPVTILVNNAGTAPTAKFEKTSDSTLDEVLDLHVRAPFRLIRAALPALREAGRGIIIQLASSAGLRGFAFTSAYTAAKHAMVGMTRALDQELRNSGVRAFAVCPGFVDTDITRRAAEQIASRGKQSAEEAMHAMASMNRIGRMHSAAEIGTVIARLCHDLPSGCVYDLDAEPPEFVST